MTSDLRAVFPDQNAAPTLAEAGFRPVIVPAREHLVGDIGATLWILLAAVWFLLLIACANVANLFLVKSDGRYSEFAIRFALGARRGHLAGSVFLESMALGLAGGLVSVPISLLAVRLLVRWGPQELPRLQEISVDSSVLAFGVAISVLAGLLLGLLPAWRTTLVAASAGLTAGARGATDGRPERRANVQKGARLTGTRPDGCWRARGSEGDATPADHKMLWSLAASSSQQPARVLTGVKARRCAPPPLRGADGLDAGSAHGSSRLALADDAHSYAPYMLWSPSCPGAFTFQRPLTDGCSAP